MSNTLFDDLYILDDDGQPQVCPDLVAWGLWRADHPDAQRVALDIITDGIRVSTIFLGIDHNYFGGPPILWETMVFGGPLDGEMERYTSRDAALKGHQAMCQRVMKAKP